MPRANRHYIPEKQEKACRAFYDTVRDNGILDSKTTILIHLAASLAFGCYPCMETYLNMAHEEGISDEEIGATEAIVAAVSAGRIIAQFRDARNETDQ